MKTKKSKCDLKNRFYVASEKVSDRNGHWVKPNLEAAINHAKTLLAGDELATKKYIVKIIAVVEKVQTPVQVRLFE